MLAVAISSVIILSTMAVTFPSISALTNRDVSIQNNFNDQHITARYQNGIICGDHMCGPGEWDKYIEELNNAQHQKGAKPLPESQTGTSQITSTQSSLPTEVTASPSEGRDVRVVQEPGKVVYWILPGPTKLDKQTFGTPQYPMNTGEFKISEASGAVKKLFEKFPIMAGVPLKARDTNENSTEFTYTKIPTPVSDNGRIVTGHLDITYKDRQPYDLPGNPNTADGVDLNVEFTDPDGNQYKLVVTKLYQPPFPGFQAGGGVITDAWIHGNTGTDSPLFPTIFTYGAFWGIGKIIINGQMVQDDMWIHVMTTQNVRDRDYHFVTSERLPLMPDETFSGQIHHTHVIVRPIKITSDGPQFEPVKTAFTLPNGMKQPFIHVMFEQDTIVKDDFKDWTPQTVQAQDKTQLSNTSSQTTQNEITIEAKEFSMSPSNATVNKGEVTILYKNIGHVAHSFVIGDLGIKVDAIRPGETTTIKFTANQSGSFEFWCGVPGHKAAGMHGILNVK